MTCQIPIGTSLRSNCPQCGHVVGLHNYPSGECDECPPARTSLVLTDNEWSTLAAICIRWRDGDTTYYKGDEELELLASRIIDAAAP